ncbi:MAG: PTS sugar transporter subunit IIB [Firmicutes bacterium]|nr:PTS sugar transporter subunit IIB [Bacillota bacterium]
MRNIRKITCVCGMGLGSGLLIKMTVQKALDKLGVKGMAVNVEVGDVSTARAFGSDLVLASPEFGPRLEGGPSPVVVVNNLLSVDEVQTKLAPHVRDWFPNL